MKRLVLALLFMSSATGSVSYKEIVDLYLEDMQDKEQHDRIERALCYLEGMEREDLEIVIGYLAVLLNTQPEPDVCDCCCDEMIEKEFGSCCQ
jgi:hypothetical protein